MTDDRFGEALAHGLVVSTRLKLGTGLHQIRLAVLDVGIYGLRVEVRDVTGRRVARSYGLRVVAATAALASGYPASVFRRLARARLRRDMTVPTGTASASAASL